MDRASLSLGWQALLVALVIAFVGGTLLGSNASAVEFTLEREIDFVLAEGFEPESMPVQVGDRVVVTIGYNETVSPTYLAPNTAGIFGAFPSLSVELVDVPAVLSGFGGPSGGIALLDNDPIEGSNEVKDSFRVGLLPTFGAVIEGMAFGGTPDSLSVALSSFGPIAGPLPTLIEGLDTAPLPPFDPDQLIIGIRYFNDQDEVERSLILQSGGEGIAVPEPSATISLVVALASVFLVARLRRGRSELVFDVETTGD
jgi:hypothetical protein